MHFMLSLLFIYDDQIYDKYDYQIYDNYDDQIYDSMMTKFMII